MLVVTLALSIGKRNVIVCQSVCCPVSILTGTHQGAACDVASIHFGPTVSRTDNLVQLFWVLALEGLHKGCNVSFTGSHLVSQQRKRLVADCSWLESVL